MKKWSDLTPDEQSDYQEGEVELYGFVWECYYKFVTEGMIQVYYIDHSYEGPCYTSLMSLITTTQ